jgi:tetratricopeptide (TPR) repeat protein
MARKIIPIVPLLLLLAVLLLSGCDSPATHLRVLQGNYAFERGDYQQSTFAYYQALESEGWEDRILYNLANVFHELGEVDAALREWDAANPGQDSELAFRIAFNRGVLLYEQARYQEAYDAFRASLKINASSIDAKINLEHALRKINRQRQNQQAHSSGGGGESSVESERILDYVRRGERQQWLPGMDSTGVERGNQW